MSYSYLLYMLRLPFCSDCINLNFVFIAATSERQLDIVNDIETVDKRLSTELIYNLTQTVEHCLSTQLVDTLQQNIHLSVMPCKSYYYRT